MKPKKFYKKYMLSLPKIRQMIQGDRTNFILKNDRNKGCFIAKKGQFGDVSRVDRRALCHFDVELKMTVDDVEYYEFV